MAVAFPAVGRSVGGSGTLFESRTWCGGMARRGAAVVSGQLTFADPFVVSPEAFAVSEPPTSHSASPKLQ
jgi:hypothetical protein